MPKPLGGLTGVYTLSLPPLSNLPTWSRAALPQKHKFCLNADKICSYGPNAPRAQSMEPASSTSSTSDGDDTVLQLLEYYKHRVKCLSNNVDFLKEEHSKILGSLHKEIEELKHENKELKFKLIISDTEGERWVSEKAASTKKGVKSAASASDIHSFESRVNSDETMILRQDLVKEKQKCKLLQQEVDYLKSNESAFNSTQTLSSNKLSEFPSSLEECYNMISSLKYENKTQQKEIEYLQSTKVVSDGQPNLGMYLPALKPSLQSKVVHRVKRQQLIRKEKAKNEVLRDLYDTHF